VEANAISPHRMIRIARLFGTVVDGSIIVTGADYPAHIRLLGAIALFASMTNIVSGFLITDRMLKMFKTERKPTAGEPK